MTLQEAMVATLRPLEAKEKRLEELESAEPEGVRVEFNRRRDRADALLHGLQRTWESLEGSESSMARITKSKFGVIGWIVFLAACVAYGLKAFPEIAVSVIWLSGSVLIGAAVRYCLAAVEHRITRVQQDSLFTEWESIGGTQDSFWALKSVSKRKRDGERRSADTDEWRSEIGGVEGELTNVMLNVRYRLLLRARTDCRRWHTDNWKSGSS